MAEISKQNLIVKGTNQCNEKWTQSSAVGGKKFVLTSKSKPCAKSQNLQDIPFDLKQHRKLRKATMIRNRAVHDLKEPTIEQANMMFDYVATFIENYIKSAERKL
jgi:hypothetical protein